MTTRPRYRSATARRHGRTAVAGALYAVALSFVLASSGVWAEAAAPGFVIVVHPANPASTVTQDFLAQAFFKRTTRWSHGATIYPVDLTLQSPVRRAFSSAVLKRSAPAVRGYWLQRIFSGRDVPPPELDSDTAVLRYVAATPGAIGYVSSGADRALVKVLSLR
jgi:PBP superfamily domain